MNMKFVSVWLCCAGLAAAHLTASAGLLTFQGVTFESTWSSNVMTIEIDAAGRTDNWTNALFIEAIAINDVGDIDSYQNFFFKRSINYKKRR